MKAGQNVKQLFNAPIEEIIRKRVSVRTYSPSALEKSAKNDIEYYMDSLSNPFQSTVAFKLLESDAVFHSGKHGTYGVIKGTKDYIGGVAKVEEFALEGLGYEMEKLMLYLTSLGFGTCWLGGTFDRSGFAKAMEVKADEIFPAITPIGVAAKKKSRVDSLVRFVAKGDSRKAWSELFFDRDFSIPLTKSDAGLYESVLEMVRLAPSASNKQPWRIVKVDNMYHFYEHHASGYGKAFDYDIQKIDMGIAACHFHLTAMEKGMDGAFKTYPDPIPEPPKHTIYCFSWISNQSNNASIAATVSSTSVSPSAGPQ